MCARFSEEDVGKTVYNAADEEVGIVAEVEHGTAHVEPDPGITDTISAKLGWGDASDGAYPLQEDSVKSVTDDAIHLKGDLGDDQTARHTDTQSGAETGGTTRTDEQTDMNNDPPMRGNDDTRGSAGKVYDEDHSGRTDDDDSLLGDDDDSGVTDHDDSLIGDDDDSGFTDDDDSLIGDDDDSRMTDDDDSLIGDDDDSGLTDDDDSLIGDDEEMSDGDRSALGDSDDDDDLPN